MTMKHIAVIISALSLSVLASCGNSSGGSSTISTQETTTVTTTTQTETTTTTTGATITPTETTTTTTTKATTKATETTTSGHRHYILNHNTGKIHNPLCHTLEDSSDEYEELIDIGMDWVNANGYSLCKVCNPIVPPTSDNNPTTTTKEYDRNYYSFSEQKEIKLKYDAVLYFAPDKTSDDLYKFGAGTILIAVGETSDFFAVTMNNEIVFCEKVAAEYYSEPVYTDAPQTDAPQTDPPQTDPPQTDPPQTDPPQTDPPQTLAVTE